MSIFRPGSFLRKFLILSTSNVKIDRWLFSKSLTKNYTVRLKMHTLKADLYGSIWVAIFNLKCNMQNDNAICKMALRSVFKFTFYITILATFGAK